MAKIQGSNISYRYRDNINYTLKNISFRLDQTSRVGLVGDNGAGKSTLINLISEELISEGQIIKDLKVGVLIQEIKSGAVRIIDHIYQNWKKLLDLRELIESYSSGDITIFSTYDELGGWDLECRIDKLLTIFNFQVSDLKRDLVELSGGEKTKVDLIKLLIDEPDLLLLDEPTNHLDLKTTLWLEYYLLKQKLPYLIVSHDREFLDRTTTTIWELENGALEIFSGNYSFYKQQ